jgi:serine/threonine protein kinase/Pyruvate/2-oxoacid:ferredoxin oxidoreductase gamma subunit
MLGDAGTLWAQGYSWYDSKKSGGLTISYLRLADTPIVAPYLIEGADYVSCHKDIYVKRGYPMADRLCDGGVFVLNTAWTSGELAQNLPPDFRTSLARKHVKFYCIDAAAIAAKVGLGARINMIMEVAYLYLARPIPFEQALAMLKDAVRTMYASKGDDVVAKNLSAIQEAVTVLAHAKPLECEECEPSTSRGSVSEAEGASGVLSAVQDSSQSDESLMRCVPSRLIHAQAEPAQDSMCSEPPSTPPASLTELGLEGGDQASPSPVQAALEEARTTAKLKADNIVTVYDFALSGDVAYVVMEYVDGATLADVLAQLDDDITLDVIAAVVKGVGAALNAAHKQGVLHLDIKPQNVLIDTSGQVKVADFGMSALMDAAGVGRNAGGTVGYMPPEQLRLGELDSRTDEWALASLVYEMLVGENPFKTGDINQAASKIEDAELVVPSLCWDDTDPFIDDVIFAALDPRLDARYDTVADFTAELLPMLGMQSEGKAQLAAAVEAVQNNDLDAEGAASATGLDAGGNAPGASGSALASAATSNAQIIPGAQASIAFAYGDDPEDEYMPTSGVTDAKDEEFVEDDNRSARKRVALPSAKKVAVVLKRVLPVVAVVFLLTNCLLNVHVDGLLDTSSAAQSASVGAGLDVGEVSSITRATQGFARSLFGVRDIGLFADVPIVAWAILLIAAVCAVLFVHVCGLVVFCALAVVSAINAFFADPIDATKVLSWLASVIVVLALARNKAHRGKCICGGVVGAAILLAGLVVLPCAGTFDAFGVGAPSAQNIVTYVLTSVSLIIVCMV